MNVADFRQLYVTELQELRSVEDQLVEALPKMARWLGTRGSSRPSRLTLKTRGLSASVSTGPSSGMGPMPVSTRIDPWRP